MDQCNRIESPDRTGCIVQLREIELLFWDNFKWSMIFKNKKNHYVVHLKKYCKTAIFQLKKKITESPEINFHFYGQMTVLKGTKKI